MRDCCVTAGASILSALHVINKSGIAMAVVCENGRVEGILTDGDLRRAITSGASLEAPVRPYYTRQYVYVGPDAYRADVLELMQARSVQQVPIIDVDRRLRGIHTLHSILGSEVKPNAAVIMAGGQGRRLGELTVNTPKPMLKVAGKPILERLVLHLVSYGFRDIYISVNYLSSVIEEYFGDGSGWGCVINYLREEEFLGSGGGLSLLPFAPEEAVVVMNGDLLIEANLSRMLETHRREQYYATMGVHYYTHEVPFGCVELDDGRIVSLEEKPVLTRNINGGVYVLSPEALRAVPCGEFFPITRIFDDGLELGLKCGAYPLDGDWIDIGVPSQLRMARGQ